ncbi:type II secretion system protein [Rhizobacter sp. SG703]|uniref:type II secretion system protein n=1 Tax=Rhizobacter sp. SG703 TaxID=2587140 RepID=UPI00144802BA|nr:type II secretion system protein [Rhizobacter sp. SG703]NKI97725.1 type II secretory pathway pseudopilin PulG [Rhizobacter sp. SG703]
MRAGSRCSTRAAAGGFTYVLVLLLVALMGLGLAVAGPRWSDAAQREREDELLRIGSLYAQAITRYHEASPGSLKQYPPSLDSLLQDTRYVGTRRHLRKLYTDPMQPGQPFALVRGADGGIRGVHSTSEAQPLHSSLPPMDGVADMPPASKYSQWIFLAKPQP